MSGKVVHTTERDDVTFREPQSFREMAAERRKEVCGRLELDRKQGLDGKGPNQFVKRFGIYSGGMKSH